MTKLGVAIAAACVLSFGLARASAQAQDAKAERDPAKILTKIHKINEMEIMLGSMAKEKAQSIEVRDYAKRLVRDHGIADAELGALAADRRITVTEPLPAGAKGGAEATEEEELRKRLESLSGADFDRAFLEAMLKGHEKAIAELRAAAEATSDEHVVAFVKGLIPTLEDHRQSAARLLRPKPRGDTEER